MADMGRDVCGTEAMMVSDNLGFFSSKKKLICFLSAFGKSKLADKTATMERWDQVCGKAAASGKEL